MTLLTAVLLGLPLGYVVSPWRRAFAVWLPVWAVVLTVQTTLLLDRKSVTDWSYWPVQAAILLLAVGMLRLGARLRRRRTATQ